jgi:hypothetical protein
MITKLEQSEFFGMLFKLGLKVGPAEIDLLNGSIALKILMILRDVHPYFPQWGMHTGRYPRYFENTSGTTGRIVMAFRPCFVRQKESKFEVVYPASALLENADCASLVTFHCSHCSSLLRKLRCHRPVERYPEEISIARAVLKPRYHFGRGVCGMH